MRVRPLEPDEKKNDDAEETANPYEHLQGKARHDRAFMDLRTALAPVPIAWEAAGNIMFFACHDGDADNAIDEKKAPNEMYRSIVRSAQTNRLGVTEKSLSLAMRVAAVDRKLVKHHFWPQLLRGQKEVLVRLKNPDDMSEGAKEAITMGLTLDALEAWVNAKRKKDGDAPVLRGVKLETTRGAFTHLKKSAQPKGLERIERDFDKLDEDDQRKTLEELDEAAAAIAAIRKRLKGR